MLLPLQLNNLLEDQGNVSVGLSGAAISMGAGAVSLGGDVVPTASIGATGGWLNEYLALQQRRNAEEKRRQAILRAVADLEGLDGEIAVELHRSESEKEAGRYATELREILRREVSPVALKETGLMTDRVEKAYYRALEQANFSAIQAFSRELERAIEEEDFLFLSMAIH